MMANDPSRPPGDERAAALRHGAAPTALPGEHYYPGHAFAELARLEADSFWFQSRNRIILSTLSRHIGQPSLRYAEIGCGTGFVLQAVARNFPTWEVDGFDIHEAAVAFSRQRATRALVRQADIHSLPKETRYDAIGLFDVLEHLDDDLGALRGIHRVLQPHGLLILTVPQHPCLWSPYDDAALHRRRYRREEMRQRLVEAGFSVRFLSSFVSALWPALWWRRRALRQLDPAAAAAATQADLTPSRWFDRLGRAAMWPDETAARLGWPLPWGGSLLAVAEKT